MFEPNTVHSKHNILTILYNVLKYTGPYVHTQEILSKANKNLGQYTSHF